MQPGVICGDGTGAAMARRKIASATYTVDQYISDLRRITRETNDEAKIIDQVGPLAQRMARHVETPSQKTPATSRGFLLPKPKPRSPTADGALSLRAAAKERDVIRTPETFLGPSWTDLQCGTRRRQIWLATEVRTGSAGARGGSHLASRQKWRS